jgi:hypothetical protein
MTATLTAAAVFLAFACLFVIVAGDLAKRRAGAKR